MAEKDSDFLKRLLKTFRVEAREHVDALFAGIDEIEKSADTVRQAELIETIFREAHSLKGAARSVNLVEIETACQSLENTLAAMKNKQVALSTELFDNVHRSIGHLSELLELSPLHKPEPIAALIPETPPEIQVRKDKLSAVPEKPVRTLAEEKPLTTGTVRIATEKLDAIFLQAEEMLSVKLLAQQRRQDLQTVRSMVAAWGKEWSEIMGHQPDFNNALAKQPPWLELTGQNSVFIKGLSSRLDAMAKAADQDLHMLEKMVDDLLEDMKKALMLPFSTLMEIFPRLVRDLAKDSGKNIGLEIQGGEIEADRRILEDIKDPLIHLLRNCVDHGIESPAERMSHRKPSSGKISIVIFPYSGNHVEIDVSDDGGGIDIDKVKEAVARLGILGQEELSGLNDYAALELIYQSGVSTSPTVTKVSGRGLGLAIVREKVEQLGGTIIVETQAGIGTTFSIKLPLTIATYSGIAVRVAKQIFVLQTSSVERGLRIRQEDIKLVGKRETLRLGDETLSLVWLSDVLGISSTDIGDTELYQVLILAASGKHIAFIVDEVLGEQEVLVKSLGPQLSRLRNISAATILGSGKVVPILNVADLLKSALQVVHAGKAVYSREDSTEQRKNVLVVEDSITSRSLLKGILEMAGYKVATAVDGMDGLNQLRNGEFDLVVSDVEMPRMNGFELTARIRSDKKLAGLPVVLVTALEAHEDRERGFDLGANAYIVKHSFEQSNLLEAVRRLIK